MVQRNIGIGIQAIILLLLALKPSEASYKTYYLEDHCDDISKPIRLSKTGPDSSAIVRVSRDAGFKASISCRLRIEPPFDRQERDSSEDEDDPEDWNASYGVVLSINSLNLRTSAKGCVDELKVSVQWQKKRWIEKLKTCSGNFTGWTVASVAAAGNRDVKVEFSSGYTRPESQHGLELTVTAYALKTVKGCPTIRGGDSSAEWFDCTIFERCVWRGLTCDEKDNCGDDSDEWQQDGAKCGLNRRQAILGVSISLGIIAFLATILIICRIRRRKRPVQPSAPLLVPGQNRIHPDREPLLDQGNGPNQGDYGSGEPPPYDHRSQYPLPPPPAYRE